MKLEDIGFYTLSDARALRATAHTRLERCELLLTRRCNFNCPYCRHAGPPDATWEEAVAVVDAWKDEHLRNVRFSGGEPTLWEGLVDLVEYARKPPNGIERVAISSNGSAPLSLYEQLIGAGANDFSISLDACCCATVGKMTGKNGDIVRHVMDVIRRCAVYTYVTIGTVITPDNINHVFEVIDFALDANVSDVRLISAAQWNEPIDFDLPKEALDKFPILSYRWNNMKTGRNVRGLRPEDTGVCRLALDDMVVSGGLHYPCIIYMREGGNPLGPVGPTMREVRRQWVDSHCVWDDPICCKNCLDVCVDYNNAACDESGGVCSGARQR